jgi:hypothetical protein
MADPFRLRVLKALTDHLKTITPANGYQSDLSDFTAPDGLESPRVFRGRDSFGQSDDLPFISILEDFRPDEQETGSPGGKGNSSPGAGTWRLLVQGFVTDDPLNPTDPAYVLAADVIKALARARKQRYDILGLGAAMPCVSDLRFKQPVVRPADGEVSSTSFFFITVTLALAEDLENPFA